MARAVVEAVGIHNTRFTLALDAAPAGSLVLLTGLDANIVKTATILGTDVELEEGCIVAPLEHMTSAVLQVSVEPLNPPELPKMQESLRRIDQTYPRRTTKVEESGEHVMLGKGEVMFYSVLHDLRKVYADIVVNVSDPVMQFGGRRSCSPSSPSYSSTSRGASIKSAKPITFLWTTTFKLGVYGPAVLPTLAVYISLMMEAIGDTTAVSDVSRLEQIASGILADGVNGLLAGLGTVAPVSIFAQSVACISLTRVANRKVGLFCCMFLILFGVLGKIGGLVPAIPAPILGGVTTYLFSAVATSSLAILAKVKFTRRTCFVVATALGPGVGNMLLKAWSSRTGTFAMRRRRSGSVKEEEYFAAQRGSSAAAAAQHQEREASRDVEGGSAADRASRHSLEKGGITP
ncbi:hypothetical protein V8E36_001214 [Tilletia maclaganii]